MIASGAVLALLFLLFVGFRTEDKPKVYVQMSETDEKELIRLCKEKARGMRVTEPAKGVKITSFYKKIKRAYKIVCSKAREKNDLNEAEKWLYDNFRLVYKATFEEKNDLKGLPGIDGVPRIVLLADFIVERSLRSLNAERIKAVMDEIKCELPLEFEELMNFPFALRYAVLKHIYILADRIIFSERCRLSALKRKTDAKMLKYNSYLYHRIRKDGSNENLERIGVDEKKITEGYNETLYFNAIATQTLFNALRERKELFTPREGIEYLRSYAVLSDCPDIKSDSLPTLLTYFRKMSYCRFVKVSMFFIIPKKRLYIPCRAKIFGSTAVFCPDWTVMS